MFPACIFYRLFLSKGIVFDKRNRFYKLKLFYYIIVNYSRKFTHFISKFILTNFDKTTFAKPIPFEVIFGKYLKKSYFWTFPSQRRG